MAWTEKQRSGKYTGYYRTPTGARLSAGTFPQKRAAQRAADEAEVAARQPGALDPRAGKITWGEWVDEWWPTREIEPATDENESSMVRNHLRPHWGDVPLDSITRVSVQGWATQAVRENLGTAAKPRYRAPSSMQRYLNVFVSSLTAAVDHKLIPANPAVKIKLPAATPTDAVFFTREEYARLVAAVPTERDRAVLNFLVGTGLRWGELAALHTHRVDLRHRFVTVADTTDGKEIKPYPKGRRQRHVPLQPWVIEGLSMPLARDCGVPHRRGGSCPSALMFAGERGRLRDDRNFYRQVFEPALSAAGLSHLGATIHDLRHTYASWLAQDGVPLGRIAELLGHASTSTTEIYAHFSRPFGVDDTAHALPDPRMANAWQNAAIADDLALRRAMRESGS